MIILAYIDSAIRASSITEAIQSFIVIARRFPLTISNSQQFGHGLNRSRGRPGTEGTVLSTDSSPESSQ